MRIRATRTTYEYECRVQILVILLHEFLIVILGLLAVMFIEFGAEILWQTPVLLSVRRVNDGGKRDAKPSLPICWSSAQFPISIPPRYSSVILAVVGDQSAVTLGFL